MITYQKQKPKKRKPRTSNNRLNIILAIIFLLTGVVVYRLYDLQVFKYDLYIALASDQHQVYNELEPSRGRIFIRDESGEEEKKLYPLATNKEFGLLYAIPPEIEDSKDTAEKLYTIFDESRITEEVNRELLENEYFKRLESEDDPLTPSEHKEIEAFRDIKRELEIKTRREQKIGDYIKKLDKPFDPYEPLIDKVDEAKMNEVKALEIEGLDFIMKRHRYYPEGNIGSHFLGFVGFEGDDRSGQYGLEGFFNKEIMGSTGQVKIERAATGKSIIINDREYEQARNGSDLILTINRSIQYAVCTRLSEEALRHGADGGTIIVMNPSTGAILAMCSWPDYDPNYYNDVEEINVYNNPAIFDDYEPGSIFKVITMAAGLDNGEISPDTVYNDAGFIRVEGWPKPIKNSDYDTNGGHGIVDMVTVLEESLNTGAIFVQQKIGAEAFAQYVRDFGFGEKTGVELDTEGITSIVNLNRNRIRPVEAATASFGQGITATPLQLINSFAAIANGGILMKPYLVDEIISPTGEKLHTQPKQIRRVISEKSALLLSGMMVNVIDGGHAQKAAVKGYYIAGKTGTAQVADREIGGYSDRTVHSFIGFAPVEDPKFVMLVKLDDPKDVSFAASSAAPLFGELAEFILNYYQIPKER